MPTNEFDKFVFFFLTKFEAVGDSPGEASADDFVIVKSGDIEGLVGLAAAWASDGFGFRSFELILTAWTQEGFGKGFAEVMD